MYSTWVRISFLFMANFSQLTCLVITMKQLLLYECILVIHNGSFLMVYTESDVMLLLFDHKTTFDTTNNNLLLTELSKNFFNGKCNKMDLNLS